MTYKDILVHIDETGAGRARAAVAAKLGSLHRAHVTGFFARVPPVAAADFAFFTEAGLQSGVYHDELQRAIEREEQALQASRLAFRDSMTRAGVESEWIILDGSSPRLIDEAARYVDLAIVGQGKQGGESEGQSLFRGNFPAELALACGRPVLALPSQAQDVFGDRMLVAWNGSRESARAVSDAMPFLERARFVALLSVQPPWRVVDQGMAELARLARHLEHCGVASERYVVQAPDHAIGEEIMTRANDAGCDLIVMGAYGHSHMRETILGGATQTLLMALPLPLLLSH